jgi:hypothetical protein
VHPVFWAEIIMTSPVPESITRSTRLTGWANALAVWGLGCLLLGLCGFVLCGHRLQ